MSIEPLGLAEGQSPGRLPRLPDPVGVLLPCGLLVAFAAVLSLQDIRSLDYWWHLRTGQLIAESGLVPLEDVFTYTARGARWVDAHWLHQLVLWWTYEVAGHAGVVVWKFVMVVATFGLIAPIGWRRERAYLSVGLLTLGLVACCSRFNPRPELPSFAALALLLLLFDRFERLEGADRSDRWIWAVIPVQLVWANFHGLFAVGLGLCSLHLGAECIRPWLVRGATWRQRRVATLAGVTAGAALVSLLNPNGWDLILQTFDQLRMIGPSEQRNTLGQAVYELQPTLGVASFERVWLVLLATISLAGFGFGRRGVRASDPGVALAFLLLALGALRNVPLFALVIVPIAVRHGHAALDGRRLPQWLPRLAGGLLSLLLAILVIGVAQDRFQTRFGRLGRGSTLGLGVIEHYNPVGAADWILRNRPVGPIAHLMNDGGYFIWRLYPDYPVMIDGRLEVFGSANFASLHIGSRRRFRALDAIHHFGVIHVLHGRGYLHEVLRWWWKLPIWRLVYVDDVSAVFVRVEAGQPSPFPEVDVRAPDLFPPLGEPHPLDRERLVARARFYDAIGSRRAALRAWDEAVDHFPTLDPERSERARLVQKVLELERGKAIPELLE